MKEIRSSIQFLPAKIMLPPEYVAGPPIKEYEYIPLELPGNFFYISDGQVIFENLFRIRSH